MPVLVVLGRLVEALGRAIERCALLACVEAAQAELDLRHFEAEAPHVDVLVIMLRVLTDLLADDLALLVHDEVLLLQATCRHFLTILAPVHLLARVLTTRDLRFRLLLHRALLHRADRHRGEGHLQRDTTTTCDQEQLAMPCLLLTTTTCNTHDTHVRMRTVTLAAYNAHARLRAKTMRDLCKRSQLMWHAQTHQAIS